MSTETYTGVVDLIDELRRSAAYNRAMAAETRRERPWLQHDERIYTEREIADLQAVMLLEEALV